MARVRIVVVLLVVLLLAVAVYARIGGGQSYGGGGGSSSSSSGSSSFGGSSSSSSGGSSSGGTASCGTMLFFFVIVFVISMAQKGLGELKDEAITISSAAPASVDMGELRGFDPNFSEIVFKDFCYSLYARVHEARGRGQLKDFAPYLSANARAGMERDSPGIKSVDEIVVGSFTIMHFSGVAASPVTADVELEANYTETTASATRRWYVRERWTLERERDLLSPAPEKAKAEHCPKCGAALETRTDGACLHCGTVISDGTFQWFVRWIGVLQKEEQPPNLHGSAPEEGTDQPTVLQQSLDRKMGEFAQEHPGFTWPDFEERVRHVANELQAAWTSRDWSRARTYETDALFQMHRYWIDEYLRQGLRNVVDGFTIHHVQAAKVASDAFYDAITVRMFASGNDYTIDDDDNVVGGSQEMSRNWSEYWTLIRGRSAAAADAKVCPNCGGALAEGQTAICGYCGGKVATGEFPWILSRIEQDESYRG